MRYWIFQNNQVNGPFEPDDLAQVSGFSAEALVCPEGRRGTNMGDWQRAGMVPELSVSLIKATQLAAAPVGVGGGIFGTLPPEPTLKDLAALGSLQEKINVLEGVLSQMQDALRLKDTELLALHREVEEKKRREAELANKLGGLEERLLNVQSMRANLDEAIAAEKKVESTVKDVEHSVKDVESSVKEMEIVVESQRETIDHLLKELEELKARPTTSAPAPAPAPAPVAAPPSVPLAVQAPPPMPAELKSFAPEPVLDLDAPAVLPPPPPPAVTSLEPQPLPEVSKPLFSDAPPVPLMDEPKAAAPQPFQAPQDLKPTDAPPPPVVESLTSAPAEPAPKSKKGPILAVVALLGLGGGYVFMTGGGSSKQPEPEPVLEAPEPAPSTIPDPAVDARVEEEKSQALGLVRMWPSGDGATVGQRLEAMPPSAQHPMPWGAEKLSEGLFQVNYYAVGSVYQFQVRPLDKQVAPINMAAKDLLEPKKPEPPKPAPKARKVRVRPKPGAASERSSAQEAPADESGLLDYRLESSLDEPQQQPRRKPAAKKKADDEATLDELLEGGEEAPAAPKRAEAAPAPAPAPKAPRKAADDGEPSDAELLDELLKP